MNKDESLILKGVAILLMLFLHLFNQAGNVALCQSWLYVGDTPLVSYLVRAANPVAFFLILGGYGMYCVWQKGDRHRWSRVGKLMTHYWLTLAVFVMMGHLLKPDVYPGSWSTVMGNVTAFDTSYNGEMWFLFPYICLTLLSPCLFKWCSRFRCRYILAVSWVIGIGTSWFISRHGAQFLYRNMWVYNPYLIVHLSFPFLLGAVAARCGVLGYRLPAGRRTGRGRIWLFLLAGLVGLRCCFQTGAFHSLYAFAFIFVFLQINRGKWVDRILMELGNRC